MAGDLSRWFGACHGLWSETDQGSIPISASHRVNNFSSPQQYNGVAGALLRGGHEDWMNSWCKALSSVQALSKLAIISAGNGGSRGSDYHPASCGTLTGQRRQKLLFLPRSGRHCLKGPWLQMQPHWLPEWTVPVRLPGDTIPPTKTSRAKKNTQEQLACKAAIQNLSARFQF